MQHILRVITPKNTGAGPFDSVIDYFYNINEEDVIAIADVKGYIAGGDNKLGEYPINITTKIMMMQTALEQLPKEVFLNKNT